MNDEQDTKPAEVTIIKAQVPLEMAEEMQARAMAAERTLSAEIRLALRAYLAEERTAA